MLFTEDAYMWFKHSEPHRRVEFVCGILNMCLPLELKFIRTFVDNLSKRDDTLKDCETKCNKLIEMKQLGKILDERTRSKLILCLALLEANNQTCSKLLYDCLILALDENDEYLANISHPDRVSYGRQMRLIFTMMMHHPAFRYEEVKLASEKLQLLEDYEGKASDCWHITDDPTKSDNQHSPHDLPNERNNVMEACDSGLSMGTEPGGEILSDHSCVPNQSDQQFSLSSMCTTLTPDKIEENKRKDSSWQIPCCPLPPGPISNASILRNTGGVAPDPVKLIAQPDLNIAPAQGAVNGSSGDSLNITEVSAVPTAYIYNSSIYEKTALEASQSGSMPIKREAQANQRHEVSDAHKPCGAKPLWIGSVSNPTNPTYSSLQSSQVASQKMATSIVTTSPQTSCYESSLSSGVITSVVVSRTARQAALPRQLSSSSSSGSHPSSPAMISGPKNVRYAAPNSHRHSRPQNHVAQSVSKDELCSIISGPLSDAISFMPFIEDLSSVSTSQQYVPTSETNGFDVNARLPDQSSAKNVETSLTVTLTTTVASSVAATAGKNFEVGQVSIASTNPMGNGYHLKHTQQNHSEKNNAKVETKASPQPHTVTSSCAHGGVPGQAAISSSYAFVANSGSSRMPAYTFYPPTVGPKHSFYYASKTNAPRPKGPGGRRRNARGELMDVRSQCQAVNGKHAQMENSTSSSQYSSPSQTPSPDIKKSDKSEVADNVGEISETSSGYSILSSNSFTDNNSPPPGYNHYQVAHNHQRQRYVPFHQQSMGFLPYHHPPGTYRYPVPNHLMMGSRPPPPSSGDKSSREVTPPSVNVTMEAPIKQEVSPTPSTCSSANLNRKSSSASPPGHVHEGPGPLAPIPNHIGHGPLPFNGPNYQMFPGPYFAPVPGFMPGHASVANGFMPQIPPNFSLPPAMAELIYQSPYPIMGAAPQPGSVGVPPYQAVLPSKPKRSPTCYNCGHVGHMGTDCNESSMVELTKCT